MMNIENLDLIMERYKTDKYVFHDLMRDQIREILLVATLYDSFILEREGELSEQIYGEYYQLNLSSAPKITQASTPQSALKKMKEKHFDMVVLMVGIDLNTPLKLSKEIKKIDKNIPVAMLLNNNANLALFYEKKPDLSAIDRVFVWNGDSKIFLAMIKHFEDLKNVENDTKKGLVRVILLIEDNIKYYSRYLPVLYAEIMKLTQRLITDENLEEMYKVLRMRARPKVILATTYEEAQLIFDKYEENLLCLISDIRFSKNGKVYADAGFQFASFARSRNKKLPIVFQSSEEENEKRALEMKGLFLNKNSENLMTSLRQFIRSDLGFGRFHFKNERHEVVASAGNMMELKELVKTIPDQILMYHASRDDFSTWFMARGEIAFAKVLKSIDIEHFSSTNQMREFILQIFKEVEHNKTKGRAIKFDEKMIGDTSSIMRFANGSLGGKGRGLLFINNLIEIFKFSRYIPEIEIKLPLTGVVGTDEFDKFMERHGFRSTAYKNKDYEKIKKDFVSASLSQKLRKRFKKFVEKFKKPLAVRSSGLFEDMLLQPFAGIYETYLIPNNHPDVEVRLRQLCTAVKLVYASIFSEKSRGYFDAVSHKIEEEKMAVVIQEVVGNLHENVFYPQISGVAQSFNYYPVSYIKPEDGITVLALGLGSYVVEGEQAFRFCPVYPKVDILSEENQVKSSQRYFYAIDMENNNPDLTKGEEVNYKKLDLSVAEKHGNLTHLASVYDYNDRRLKPSLRYKGLRVLNFANIVKYNYFPLADTIQAILNIGKQAMGTPVEIEFALEINKDTTSQHNSKASFYMLQLKPLINTGEDVSLEIEEIDNNDLILFTKKTMGNGVKNDVLDIIFVKPEKFDKSKTEEMATEVGILNAKLKEEKKKYILIGPGRWGTRDKWLGIPVNFAQISNASVIVETTLENYKVDSSMGSHFFHNITSMNIGYFTVAQGTDESFIDWDFLNSQKPLYESEFIKHIRFEKPAEIIMDGKKTVSIIKKP